MMMMRPQLAKTTLRLLLYALYISGASAVLCNFHWETAFGDNAVSNQAELETMYAGCTEIEGYINIAANYTGRFYLNNVTTISGGISTPEIYHRETGEYERIPVPLLTSIQVNYINDTSVISIYGAPALTYVSFPSLTVANGTISLVGIGEGCIVDFPVLTSTNSLVISGSSTEMSFPLLVDGGYMTISGGPITERDKDEYLNVDRVDHPPVDISFWELQKASAIFLQGNIRSLDMPQLSTIEDEYYRHLIIRTHGDPLDISLPNLSDPGKIAVVGTIGSISFPSLISLKTFEVNTSTPLNVTLDPIQTIRFELTLVGNVTEVSMSSVTELNVIDISSDYGGFYCSSITSDVERITGSKPRASQCSGRVKSKLPLILGLSIGLGVSLFLAIVGYLSWRRSRRKKLEKKASDKPPEYELGVPPTYTADGLPTYDASEGERGSEQGAADVTGDRTGDTSSVRGEVASEHSAGDEASARPVDGSSAHQDGAAGRRVV